MAGGYPHKQLAEIGGREYAAIDGGSSRLPADALRIELTGLLQEFVSGVDVEYAVLEAGWRKLVEAWISLEG
jgi:hypothetical protein